MKKLMGEQEESGMAKVDKGGQAVSTSAIMSGG